MKPGIREDDLLIDVWEACAQFDRPQDVFRTMLRRGLRAMVESGDMPKAVTDACNLEVIVERRKPRGRQEPVEQPAAYPSAPYSGQPPYYPPQAYPAQPPQGYYAPQPDPAQWRREEARAPQHDHGHDRGGHQPHRHVPVSQDDYRAAESDRRAPEEKVPQETPRPPAAPIPEKRPEQPPRAEQPRPPDSPPVAGKGRKLGNLM